jgi:hypothetical protein
VNRGSTSQVFELPSYKLPEKRLFSVYALPNKLVEHASTLPTRIPNASYLWAGTPVSKNASCHLHSSLEMIYFLEQKISAGDGFSRNRALAGSCR